MVSELEKLRPAPSVLAWVAVQRPADPFLSVITLGDIDIGVHAHPNPTHRDRLLVWCDGLQNILFRDRILSFDADAARACGDLVLSSRDRGRTLEWHGSQSPPPLPASAQGWQPRNTRHFVSWGLDHVSLLTASARVIEPDSKRDHLRASGNKAEAS